MPHLTRATTTQEIEFEIDIIELVYDHVDSVEDLETLLEGISSHTVEQYKDNLKERAKEDIYDNINSVEELVEFIGNIDESIVVEYQQDIVDKIVNKAPADLIDAVCSSNQDELLDVLVCVLNQYPKVLHQFLVSQQKGVQLAMIESAQALMNDLEDYF